MKLKQWTEAVEHYTQSITNNEPELEKAFANRSFAFKNLDKFEEAFEDAKKTVDLNPRWYCFHY